MNIIILDLWDIKIDLKYCHGNVSTFQGFTNEYIYIYTHIYMKNVGARGSQSLQIILD